jgi:DNA (cytosine-5)-methyltransferase 1
MPIKIIDLFAGAGGLTEGFREAFGDTLQPVWANDFNKDAVDTYNANFGSHCVHGDIVDLLSNPTTTIPTADVVMGGPPCQGFSLLNKNREGDPRKELWRPFMEIVERSGASIFVMENVPQLLDSEEHEAIRLAAQALGFATTSAKLTAADYGVPQVRSRAFIIGCRFTDPSTVFPPPKTHHNPRSKGVNVEGLPSWRTVADAVADLPPPVGTEIRKTDGPLDIHFGRSPTPLSMARYRAIPCEGMNRFDLQRVAPELTPGCWIRKTSGGTDLFGRLWWDRPAFTIRTEFYKPEKGRYLHPEQHRPITHREAARLQTFPDTFRFCGSKIEIARQIGNAVPVGLAAAVASSVARLLEMREHGR